MMRPPIPQLGIVLLFLRVPLFLAENIFISFSGIPRVKHLEVLFLEFYCQLLYPPGL
jgi:hypothetical protein